MVESFEARGFMSYNMELVRPYTGKEGGREGGMEDWVGGEKRIGWWWRVLRRMVLCLIIWSWLGPIQVSTPPSLPSSEEGI